MMASQVRRLRTAGRAGATAELNPDGSFVDGVVEQALVATVQFDGEQRVRHRIHHARGGFLRTPHATAHAAWGTVLPPQVRKRSHDGHDALNGVVVLQSLSGQVSRRIARPSSGSDAAASRPTWSVSAMPKPRWRAPSLRCDANGRTLFSKAPFLARSSSRTCLAWRNEWIRSAVTCCACLVRTGRSPSNEKPRPSSSASHPALTTRSSPS